MSNHHAAGTASTVSDSVGCFSGIGGSISTFVSLIPHSSHVVITSAQRNYGMLLRKAEQEQPE